MRDGYGTPAGRASYASGGLEGAHGIETNAGEHMREDRWVGWWRVRPSVAWPCAFQEPWIMRALQKVLVQGSKLAFMYFRRGGAATRFGAAVLDFEIAQMNFASGFPGCWRSARSSFKWRDRVGRPACEFHATQVPDLDTFLERIVRSSATALLACPPPDPVQVVPRSCLSRVRGVSGHHRGFWESLKKQLESELFYLKNTITCLRTTKFDCASYPQNSNSNHACFGIV